MRLTELRPKWVTLNQWAATSPPFYIGVSFDCPHCIQKGTCPTCGHYEAKRLSVSFWPPIDPESVMGRLFELPPNGGHARTNDTFDTLTLVPSVGFDSIGHWHGNITNGNCLP